MQKKRLKILYRNLYFKNQKKLEPISTIFCFQQTITKSGEIVFFVTLPVAGYFKFRSAIYIYIYIYVCMGVSRLFGNRNSMEGCPPPFIGPQRGNMWEHIQIYAPI